MSDNRRSFLKKSALLGLTGLAGGLIGKESINNLEAVSNQLSSSDPLFVLPKLPFAYDALEPFIDKKTMEIHHTKHHQGYIDKLNAERKKSNINMDADDAGKCMSVDSKTSDLIRNNLGGYYNHCLFWTLLKPNPERKENRPVGKLAEAITKDFKFPEELQKEFSEKANKIFGSGWCWLIADEKNNLKVVTTSNQDNPLMKVVPENGRPVLVLDLWEHAFYLKYQNRRPEYISNWWHLINWEMADKLFTGK
ncbi:superoxide dismutase [Aurantibacillus circumpalustris]|uniref:superoxide dismutase n=1 Tax=Aurantibacillus circumpalustris TaxID=3036359 RepID=UPI00295B7D4E|nr:superoxide dismutase [Aurantibacillus circumpalustris]